MTYWVFEAITYIFKPLIAVSTEMVVACSSIGTFDGSS